MSTTTSQTPKRISRAGALTAARQGGAARRAGDGVAQCPYPPDGSVVDRFLAFYWRKGWAAAADDTSGDDT